MNCKDFENTIHELVSQRVADKSKQLAALEHAGQCLWCALRFDEETKLTEKLQAFASTLRFQRAPARVEEELLRAFRESNSAASAPALGIAGRRLRRGLGWGLAFAAMAAAAWIVVLLWPYFRFRAGEPPDGLAKISPTVALPIRRSAGPVGAGLKGAAPQNAYAWSLERTALGEPASELTPDFMSLGTCDDSQCMEEATLVRVSLPAEALLAFGLGTGNDYAPDGSVQADVILASNGVPFAIRFVE